LGTGDYTMEETVNNTTGGEGKGPLTAIGLFLSVFGAAVLFGIIFTETSHGRITNAICGGIIFLIGVGALLIGRSKKK